MACFQFYGFWLHSSSSCVHLCSSNNTSWYWTEEVFLSRSIYCTPKPTLRCFKLSYTVPSEPPQNITGRNTSSTTLHIRWDPPHVKFIHGILLEYKVFYKKVEYTGAVYSIKTVGSNQKSTYLTHLVPFTTYCIRLAGVTSKGDGSLSGCLNLTTDVHHEGEWKRT